MIGIWQRIFLFLLGLSFAWNPTLAFADCDHYFDRDFRKRNVPALLPAEPIHEVSLPIDKGDFLQQVWQLTNTYRSRYKPMADEFGKPITDIEAYIRDRKIPVQFHGFYRVTSAGTYEEDIIGFPNNWLSYINSNESKRGAESYLRHLEDIVGIPTPDVKTARDRIEVSLQAIYLDWYVRNSSWTIPNKMPVNFGSTTIHGQYIAAYQFYKIAEGAGAFHSPLWREAFDQIIQKYALKKFEPYLKLSPENAYILLTQKAGTRPPVEYDPNLQLFLEKKLKRYPFKLKAGASEYAAVKSFLVKYFSNVVGASESDFEIKPPAILPGSTARIFLIVSSKDTLIAALKVQQGINGLHEVVSTAATEIRWKETRPTLHVAKNIAYGKLKGDDYFILQEAAHSFESDLLFDLPPDKRLETIRTVARTVSEMHGPFQEFNEESVKNFADDLRTFQNNAFYDIRRMRHYLNSEYSFLDASVVNHELPLDDATRLKNSIREITDRYAKIVENTPWVLSPTEVHGDFHGGNIFLDESLLETTLIDYSFMTYTIGKKMGTGDRANDLGRLMGNLLIVAIRRSIPLEEVDPLIREFYKVYRDSVKIKGEEAEQKFRTAAEFYLHRFVMISATDTANRKFKPYPGESVESLRLRFYQTWTHYRF
jgi:hypothetical protein